MKKLLLFLISVLTLQATTVTGTLLRANGQPYSGNFKISWPTYVNASNVVRRAGFVTVTLNGSGVFSVSLEPHVNTPASGAIYTVTYDGLKQGTLQTEYWDVPNTTTIDFGSVLTFPPAPPLPSITSLPNLGVIGTITIGVWHGTPITVPYGGTGVSTITGVVKGNGTSPLSVVAGTSTDCVRVDATSTPCGSGGGGLSGSAAIDFASMSDGQCLDNTFTLTGLVAGQSISVGLPDSLNSGILSTGIASATNTAKIRLCNVSGAAVDLGSLTYSVAAPTAISGSGTINFGSIVDGACATPSTFTVTGAAPGTRISIGPPAALESGLILRMVVTAADTVSVQPCNFSGAALDPASGTFSAAIL